MRIIHVASYKDGFFNGIKSVLENLVPGQRELGHDVLLLNQEYNSTPLIEGEKYVSGRKDFISWQFLLYNLYLSTLTLS